MQDRLDAYYKLLDQWLKYYGFADLNINDEVKLNVDKVFTRGGFKASKFGKVDTYCCIKYMHEGATGSELKDFSEKMFTLANRHRSGLPLGFGAMMVVYPLIVMNSVSPELASFIKTYCPKHFAAAEFPVVLDLSTGYIYYYESTPVWGYAYYAGYRREAYNLYSPRSWETVGGTNNK